MGKHMNNQPCTRIVNIYFDLIIYDGDFCVALIVFQKAITGRKGHISIVVCFWRWRWNWIIYMQINESNEYKYAH